MRCVGYFAKHEPLVREWRRRWAVVPEEKPLPTKDLLLRSYGVQAGCFSSEPVTIYGSDDFAFEETPDINSNMDGMFQVESKPERKAFNFATALREAELARQRGEDDMARRRIGDLFEQYPHDVNIAAALALHYADAEPVLEHVLPTIWSTFCSNRLRALLALDRHEFDDMKKAVLEAARGYGGGGINAPITLLHDYCEAFARAADPAKQTWSLPEEMKTVSADLRVTLMWPDHYGQFDLLIRRPDGSTVSSAEPGNGKEDALYGTQWDSVGEYLVYEGQPGEYEVTVRQRQGRQRSSCAVLRVSRNWCRPNQSDRMIIVPLERSSKVSGVVAARVRL